ncbi:MAG: sulfatase-like hydrolase/transferase [Phycisphaerae bacterium]|nr:sulfatase-like hydrolase/transferase [Phycisphaerae bacterium]
MATAVHDMNRRWFLRIASGSLAGLVLHGRAVRAEDRTNRSSPNFLWISTEDISPDLGCYGQKYAVTPNLDRLASQGVRYNCVFSHSGVCAPTRSGIITGMYPTTIGTHHMRCQGIPPHDVRCFSEYLRAAGYYCTNNVKTDYQFDSPLTAWDECSNKAHWRNRPKDKPFFAVVNFTTTHESQIRDPSPATRLRLNALVPTARHDPMKADLPPYYPDTVRVRQDWARYHDLITAMDHQVQEVLDQLDADGLAEDTIVWFWGDHGRGLPRAKRWVYDSGSHIPLLVRIPEKWRKLARPDDPEMVKPGAVNDDLIAIIDFAPTILSLANVEIPKHIQGRAFLGRCREKPRDYVFGGRDRMDEAYDLIRTVRDKRFRYIRNYMSHLSRGQTIDYVDQMPTVREMRSLLAEGRLRGPQMQYFEPTKPVEELYDTWADPHEVNNLASDRRYGDVLERMRRAHMDWCRETMDIGLIPEPIFDEMKRPGGKFEKTSDPLIIKRIDTRGTGETIAITCLTQGASIAWRIGGDPETKTGWQLYVGPVRLESGEVLYAKACRLGFKDSEVVAFKWSDSSTPPKGVASLGHWQDSASLQTLRQRLMELKELDFAGPNAVTFWLSYLDDPEPLVRYWAMVGLHASAQHAADLALAKPVGRTLLEDPSMVVRIAAAHAMCDWGEEEAGLPVLVEALKHPTDKMRLFAMVALDKVGQKARPALAQIQAAAQDPDQYVTRVAKTAMKRLEGR